MSLGRDSKGMVVGEGLLVAALLTLRAVACGNVVSLSLDSNLVEASHPSPVNAIGKRESVLARGVFEGDGGGGRIRTFEVCDGRFTVCSLWPLGNPTTG